jgi:ubiquinone/menaquinone biosynthesis C-methylase UbiE
MKEKIFFEIQNNLPRESPGRDKYTRKAFRMIPILDNPRILDIGCGTGRPTLEIARLSGGEVIGIDTHQPFLNEFAKEIEKSGLSDRVRAINCSMFEMDFPTESFDIIWAEGSIYAIGFERGLFEWRRFIKPYGYMAVHETAWIRPNPPSEIHDYWKRIYPRIKTVRENLKLIAECDYSLIGYFTLPEDAWWIEYYSPLEKIIGGLGKKYGDNPEALKVIEGQKEEIEMYKKYKKWFGSAFFVMQRNR